MSREAEYLGLNSLIGFVSRRGKAWWWRKGDEDSHFDGAVPPERVESLFDFTFEPHAVGYLAPDGNWTEIPGKAAWIRSDTGSCGGIHSDKYSGHQYLPWLYQSVYHILNGEVSIGSAGLLQHGAQAYVQVEFPENFQTSEGVNFRPWLLLTTAFDGSIASTIKPGFTDVVCDNTRDAFLSEKGAAFRVRHTRHSSLKIADAQAALGIITTMADDFTQEVSHLCNITVTDAQWDSFLNSLVPIADDAAPAAKTRAENRRDELTHLYRADDRCSPWNGTAWGALQAVNTWTIHASGVRKGAHRLERVMGNVLNGSLARVETDARDRLMAVLAK